MTLRNLLFVVMDVAFSMPRVLVLLFGAIGYAQGWATLGQLTTAILYVEVLWGPFDMLVHTVDRVQVGVASTTRLLGIATVQPPRRGRPTSPSGPQLVGTDLRYAYRADHDVLHGIDLDLRTGERLAIVGPSGSGKSTLGRLLSGIHGPRTGSVAVGGVELAPSCRSTCCAPRSPSSPRNITCSSARCATTSCSRVRTPPTRPSSRHCERSNTWRVG